MPSATALLEPAEEPAMSSSISGPADLLALVLEDHAEARRLLDRIDDPEVDLLGLFAEIVRTLAVHEVAEEEILYPAVRSWVAGGHAITAPRLDEQREAKELLAAMEKLDPTSGEFRTSLQRLKTAALEHASEEEAEVLPALKGAVDPVRLATLGKAYTLAKLTAPSHPYPMAPNTFPANILVLPAIAIVDRAYDAIWTALRKASA